MATTNTWDQVVQKITGVANRGSFSKTFTPSMNSQSQTGEAGYYSSVYAACNALELTGSATPAYVMSGYTFYNTNLSKKTGTMVDRGRLNWSGSNTTYSVPAGYYSGGTLDSRTSYNNGYNAGVAAGAENTRVVKRLKVSASASSNQRAFVDNDKNGDTTNCRYIAVKPDLTAYTVTYVYWFYNNSYLCAGCTGSTGNVRFATSTFHAASSDNIAKNLMPQYSGGTFYLPTGSGGGVAHTVYFYYV